MTMQWNGVALAEDIHRRSVMAVTAATIFLRDKVRELISVPAPRRRVFSPSKKTFHYVATVPATPGAPPRKLSGRLRASMAFEVETLRDKIIGRVGTNVIYGRRLEFSNHYYLQRTLDNVRPQIETMLGRADFSSNLGTP